MDAGRLVSITISIPKPYRGQLIKMAALRNLKNPDERKTLSELGREILCDHLDRSTGGYSEGTQGGGS